MLKLCNIAFIKVSIKATFNGQPLVCYITQHGIAFSVPPWRFSRMRRSNQGCNRTCLAVRSAPMAGEQRYETPQRHHVACYRPWSINRVIRPITFNDIVKGVDMTYNGALTVIKGKIMRNIQGWPATWKTETGLPAAAARHFLRRWKPLYRAPGRCPRLGYFLSQPLNSKAPL